MEIRKEFMKDTIYQALREEIITLSFPPGEKLSENKISEKYGVSRSPVRTVFQKLEAEKLVVIDPQRGTFVTKLDFAYIKSVIYMRWCIEVQLFSAMAAGCPESLLSAWEENLNQQRRYATGEDSDPVAFTALDNEFHHLCYVENDKDALWEIIQQSNAGYLRFRMLDLVGRKSYTQIYADHCQLFDAVREKKPQQLPDLMRHHLYGHLQTYDGVIKAEYQDYFL